MEQADELTDYTAALCLRVHRQQYIAVALSLSPPLSPLYFMLLVIKPIIAIILTIVRFHSLAWRK